MDRQPQYSNTVATESVAAPAASAPLDEEALLDWLASLEVIYLLGLKQRKSKRHA